MTNLTRKPKLESEISYKQVSGRERERGRKREGMCGRLRVKGKDVCVSVWVWVFVGGGGGGCVCVSVCVCVCGRQLIANHCVLKILSYALFSFACLLTYFLSSSCTVIYPFLLLYRISLIPPSLIYFSHRLSYLFLTSIREIPPHGK